ncbi:MAG: hypothetical protein LBE20_05910 [Deltaproteobacteria bacterium]|jgi:hypothetical protein|nr:hypothetical protein [Deltaproteobacteria bacterium]
MKLLIYLIFLLGAVVAHAEESEKIEELKKQLVQTKTDLENLRVATIAFKQATVRDIMTDELIVLKNQEIGFKQELVRLQEINENLRQLLKATNIQTSNQAEMLKMRKELNIALTEMAELCAKN